MGRIRDKLYINSGSKRAIAAAAADLYVLGLDLNCSVPDRGLFNGSIIFFILLSKDQVVKSKSKASSLQKARQSGYVPQYMYYFICNGD